MTPEDRAREIAKFKFEGGDLRFLEQMIRDQKEKIKTLKLAIGSFFSDRGLDLERLQAPDLVDSPMKLDDADRVKLAMWTQDLESAELSLKNMQEARQAYLNGDLHGKVQ